jgi:hypothetical protein
VRTRSRWIGLRAHRLERGAAAVCLWGGKVGK